MLWKDLLFCETSRSYYHPLMQTVIHEYENNKVYPERSEIFRALELTSLEDVKVVIMGQDPYYNGQADGLAFSVREGIPIPPSLRNIFKELTTDIGCPFPRSGSLVKWAEQGVLLLNAVLTVRAGEPNSHRGLGWENMTRSLVEGVSELGGPTVFILWGKSSQELGRRINTSKHLIIESSHPSPHSASRGFFGSKPFSKANEFLKVNGIGQIDWSLS